MRRRQGGIIGAAAIILLGVVALAGCGSSQSTVATTQRASLSEVCGGMTGADYAACAAGYAAGQRAELEEGASPREDPAEAAPSTSVPMNSVATLHLRSEEGYAARVELRRAKPTRARAGMQNGSLVLGSACSVNYRTDAVEPFELTTTNTTHGYAASPAIDVIPRTPYGELPGVSAEIGYSDGPECIEFTGDAYPGDENTNGQDYLADGPTEPLEPGNSTSAQGFFIVSNYYSPAKPHGDPTKISGTILELEPQTGGEGFLVTSASGVLASEVVDNAIPMLPGSNGGCLAHPPCPPLFRTE